MNDLASIIERIVPVEIRTLKHYEDPSRAEISKLTYSLGSAKFIRDPIIVDQDLELLIDGHHRAAAFQWLGRTIIPAFTVPYLSDSVQVRQWRYSVNASAKSVRAAFSTFNAEDSGRFEVVARSSSGQEIVVSRHEYAMTAARYLEHVLLFLSAGGHSIQITGGTVADVGCDLESIIISLGKPVGKTEVLDAISLGLLYPQQVNRHIVDCRPLGLNFPLDLAANPTEFRAFCDGILRLRQPRLVQGPSVVDGRFYEERTLQFDGKS